MLSADCTVFQTTLHKTPESSLAILETSEFLKEYLNHQEKH